LVELDLYSDFGELFLVVVFIGCMGILSGIVLSCLLWDWIVIFEI
jgi:hypothetical protein